MPAVACLRVVGVPRRRLDELSGRLFALGATGLQEDWMEGQAPPPRQPWDPPGPDPEPDPLVVSAWFEDPDRAAIDAVVARYGSVAWEEVEDVDWEAQSRAGFPPLEVAPGFWLAPPWDAPPGALVIDPGRGFGTGHHPSTRTALRLLLRAPIQPGGTALDVGCGSGVLALAAERLGLRAIGIDVEEPAVRDAEANARLNGLIAQFSTTPLARVPGAFDVVLANLHAELVVALAAELIARTGGALIVAGVLADREPLVHAALGPRLRPVDREVEDEWVAIRWEPAR